MNHRDIVVIGASAGGVDALRKLVSQLPENLNASVFVVLHVSPHCGAIQKPFFVKNWPALPV